MEDNKENVCSAAPTLIFACSGAADVGAIADRAARKLTADGAGKMYCLAGIGGRVPGILKTTEEAEKILAIDGCPLDCTKLSLEEAGFTEFEHIKVTDLDLEKGKSPATDENIATVVQAMLLKLSD
ncbi:MAG TPA: zinc-binding protein [Candidatus Aminicenantes bacterium]|nr:zinc-binding protein [Candidatus Aminicenantes bacterium]HEB35886.1 zinc-binding protein [Candidatus Aminicenantes bacterium]